MKKLLFALTLLFAATLTVSSCKSKEKCEAYSSKISISENQNSY